MPDQKYGIPTTYLLVTACQPLTLFSLWRRVNGDSDSLTIRSMDSAASYKSIISALTSIIAASIASILIKVRHVPVR
jgi:hypothetical protein